MDGQHTHPDLEDPDLLVKFSGPDVDLLLANKGELLLALELLTMEALRMPPEHHSECASMPTITGSCGSRSFGSAPLTAAEKVKQTRRPFHFNPMNSRERRIIHLCLRNETDIRSESTGTGPFRQVVVLPIGMPLPEPIRPPRPGPPGRSGPPGRRSGPRADGRAWTPALIWKSTTPSSRSPRRLAAPASVSCGFQAPEQGRSANRFCGFIPVMTGSHGRPRSPN